MVWQLVRKNKYIKNKLPNCNLVTYFIYLIQENAVSINKIIGNMFTNIF